VAAARAEMAHLDEIEAKLAAARTTIGPGQDAIQKRRGGVACTPEGQRDAASRRCRQRPTTTMPAKRLSAMENNIGADPRALGRLYLDGGMI